MNNRDDCGSSSVAVISFLTGTLIGAGIALLVAPKTGKETREMLKDYGAEMKEKASDLPGSLKEHTEEAIDQGKGLIQSGKDMISQGTEIVSHGTEYLDEKKHALSSAIDAGKEAMQQEKEKLTATLGDD